MSTDCTQAWQPIWTCLWRDGRKLWLLEEGHEAASASATDIEDSTSDAASTAASDPADPTVAIPDAANDPTEQEIASAADQLDILISQPVKNVNPSTPRVHSKSTLPLNHYARRKHLLWLRLRSYLVHCNVK